MVVSTSSLIEGDIRALFPTVVNDDDILGIELQNNFGLHLHIGVGDNPSIKTDILNWTVAEFIFPALQINDLRLATVEEIALMKLNVISRGGRKKDFWDLSEILETHRIKDLLDQYSVKYPYEEIQDIIDGLENFEVAEQMPDPICLKQKHWDLIKAEMHEVSNSL